MQISEEGLVLIGICAGCLVLVVVLPAGILPEAILELASERTSKESRWNGEMFMSCSQRFMPRRQDHPESPTVCITGPVHLHKDPTLVLNPMYRG